MNNNWNTPAGKELVWRARAEAALPLLAKIIRDPAANPQQQLKFFRAFDFHEDNNKQKILLSLLEGHHPQQGDIDALTLLQLNDKTARTATINNALRKGLNSVAGTPLYIDLVRKYKIKDENPELLKFVEHGADDAIKTDALRLLLESGGSALITKILQQGDEASLLNLLKSKQLPGDLKPVATDIFTKTHRKEIREEAARYLNIQLPTSRIPPVAELMTMKGNADSGAVAFTTYCSTSQTEEEISIKMIGGIIEKFRKAEIVSKTQNEQSLMPEGLAEGMGARQLANVVAYLELLKRK